MTPRTRWQRIRSWWTGFFCVLNACSAPVRHRGGVLSEKVGRKGGYLLLFGLIYGLIGFNLIVNVPPSTLVQYTIATWFAPLWLYGVLWMITGVVAVISGLTLRLPGGYAGLTGMATLWAFVWLAAWVHGDASRGYQGVLIYGAFAASAQLVAGMVEPHGLTAPHAD